MKTANCTTIFSIVSWAKILRTTVHIKVNLVVRVIAAHWKNSDPYVIIGQIFTVIYFLIFRIWPINVKNFFCSKYINRSYVITNHNCYFQVAEYESTTYAIFFNNAMFLALLILASFYVLRGFSPSINYIGSMALASGIVALLSTGSQ